jgi:pimeloyl-ACP methyl ester carboxylesterase
MRLWMMLCLSLAALVAQPAAAGPRKDVRLVQTGDRTLAYAVFGDHGPTIVFISGLGDGLDAARDVAMRLAVDHRVIVYDRAGYGDSTPLKGARTSQHTIDELDAVLNHAQVPAPVILIGHSVGGQFAELYAGARPDRVAGLVLDDARPGDFTARCLSVLPRAQCVPPALMVALFPPAMAQDYAASTQFETGFTALKPYAGPVLVLSRKAGSSPFDRAWVAAQDDLALRYRAVHATAPRGGHYIHRDAAVWFDGQIRAFSSGLAGHKPTTNP